MSEAARLEDIARAIREILGPTASQVRAVTVLETAAEELRTLEWTQILMKDEAEKLFLRLESAERRLGIWHDKTCFPNLEKGSQV